MRSSPSHAQLAIGAMPVRACVCVLTPRRPVVCVRARVKLAALDKDLRTKLALPPPMPAALETTLPGAEPDARDGGAGGKALESVMDWAEHAVRCRTHTSACG